jgi:dolichol-phosphate mannosyltransferase
VNDPRLTVLVTTFNEEGSIEACLRRILAVYPCDCEVLVVDGGFDRTGEIVQDMAREFPAIRYVRNENDRGKGHAVQTGIAAARGQFIAQIDADLQFLPEELPRLLAPLEAGTADVVLGSRFLPGSVRRPGSTPWLRTFGNFVTSRLASWLVWHRMSDILAGMKAWTREASGKIPLRTLHCSYDAEIAVKAVMQGLRVVDVPITTDARQAGESQIHVARDGLVILRDIILYRLGWR